MLAGASAGDRELSFVQVQGLSRRFDLSEPWLARLLSGKQRRLLTAVDNVSFSIERGSTYALVGESGSGKSTIARMVVGLLPPSAGSVSIDGVNLADPKLSAQDKRQLRHRLQMVFQSPYASLNPRWRVRDILLEPIKVFQLVEGKAAQMARVGQLLDQVGLSAHDGAKYPHEFSGGQRQRISIARALASNPDVIICDEPTSALDVSVQAQVLNLLKTLQQEFQLTYLFISHDLAVVSTIANQVGVLNQGQLIEEQSAHDLFTNPQAAYTRKLLTSAPKVF